MRWLQVASSATEGTEKLGYEIEDNSPLFSTFSGGYR